MRIDRVKRISEHTSVFLVGPNGAGKSRTLKTICEHLRSRDEGYSIAISNTPYARLPARARKNYAHIKVNSSTTNSLLRKILFDALDSDSFGLISIREVLNYTGYAPVLGIKIQMMHVRTRVLNPPDDDGYGIEYPNSDDSEIERLAYGIKRVVGRHTVTLDDSSTFLTRFEDIVRTIKFQSDINRRLARNGLKVAISFSLIRDEYTEVELNKASSGELTLITTAMFALSHRRDLRNIFIDEPENSLHPMWQVKFFDFMTSLLRREDINFFFATHSAVLANGALSSEIPVHIIRCRGNEYEEIVFSKVDTDESVEQLLWEAFDTVTPASSYLSETISNLIWQVEENQLSKQAAVKLIDQFLYRSFSSHQKEFLTACKKLILRIKR